MTTPLHAALEAAFAHAATLGSVLNDTSTVEQCLAWLDEEERLGRAAAEAFVRATPNGKDADTIDGLWRNLEFMANASATGR